MKRILTLACLLLAAPSWAAPPKLVIPPLIPATSDYVIYVPDTDAKAVSYVGFTVDAFPANLLADPKAFCLPVRGLPAGQYRFAAVGTLGDEQTRTDFAVVVGQTPQPPVPPGPTPDPPTPVPPDPDPFEGSGPGLKCLVVVETSELSKLPRPQVNVLTAAAIRTYLNAKCIREGMQPAWRVWDRDVSTTYESALWQKAFAKVPKDKVPWILIGNGTNGYNGPLPGTVEDTLKLLTKYGG